MTSTVFRRAALCLVIFAFALVAACGGTKVYDTSKTIVYNGELYQVTDVKQISSKIEGVTPERQTIDLKNRSKDEISDLIEQHDPLFVRMSFMLDEQPLVYQATEVDSYRDFNRMRSRFENAGEDIADLMASKKTEQLELR